MEAKFTGRFIAKLIAALFCVTAIILSFVFLRHLPKYMLVAAIATFSVLCTGICGINDEKKEAIYKFLLLSVAVCFVCLIGYIVLDGMGLLDKITSLKTIKQFILDTKQWGIIIFLLLTVFQVVVLPIPAPITVLIGVAIYGPVLSFALSTLGTLIGSLIAFVLGKIFGKKLVAWMIGKEKTDKYSEVLNAKGRFAFILMLLFPCFPDDILCLVAGISSMSYKYFIAVICLTRPVMIAFYSFFGSGSIIPFEGWGIPVWIALFCLSFIAFLLLNRLKNRFLFRRHIDIAKVR